MPAQLTSTGNRAPWGGWRWRRRGTGTPRPDPLARRRGAASLLVPAIVLLAVFAVPLAQPFPLTDPDEGLHAQIAREMVESGDWVTPRFEGEPFYDKPILFFWATAGSLAVFGNHEAAARLPALLFGLWGVAATWLLARELFRNATAASAAALMLGTSIHYVVQSQVVVHDIALTVCLAWAMFCLWCWDVRPAPGNRKWLVAAGLFMGLACLAKGLLGIVMPGLIFGAYLTASHRLTLRKSAGLVFAAALGVLLAVPWYLLMERANPGYLRYFVWERHVMGFLGNEQRHGDEPVWYYLPVLLVGGWPWVGYLPATLRGMWRRWRRSAPPSEPNRAPAPQLFVLVWIGTVFGFFTFAGSKLHTYVLPLYPALALLLGRTWQHHLAGETDALEAKLWGRAHGMVCCVSAIAAPAMVLGIGIWRHHQPSWMTWVAAGSISVLPLCSWRLYHLSRGRAAVHVLGGAMAGAFAMVVVLLMPLIAAAKSHKEMARVLRVATPRTDVVLWWRDRAGSVAFYGIGARIDELETRDELIRKTAQRPVRLVVRQHSAPAIERIAKLAGSPHYDVEDYRVYYLR